MSAERGRLWQRLRESLRATAARPAITFLNPKQPPFTWSGAALLERVETLASALGAVPRVGPLGILVSSQEQQVLHFLAALSLGQVPAILTPPNRKLRLDHYQATLAAVTRRCRFSAIVSDVALPDAEAPLLEPLTLRRVQDFAAPAAEPIERAPFVQFSSGTTGIKRGVLVSDGAVLAQLDTYGRALELTRDDVIVSWLPLYHDMGFVACFLMPLAHGVHTVMLNPLDWVARPSSYLRAVTEHRATLSWHPNFAYAFLADRVTDEELSGVDLSSLRGLVNCSEPATHESQRRFAARMAPHGLAPDVFYGCYAMAETTYALTHGCARDAGYLDARGPTDGAPGAAGIPAVSVGRPLPGVELEIVDDAGRLLPERHVGEIRVRSPFNLDGYYANPEATATAVRDGWYHTGDLGYRVGDELFVSGRKKDVLIVSGVNVWPHDLEAVASEVPGVHAGRAVAFAEFDPNTQTEKVVLLAEPDGTAPDARMLVAAIRQRLLSAFQLANFEVSLVPPGWLLKSSSGKLSRSQNRERWSLERARA